MAARETGDPGKDASQSGAMDRTSSPAKPQWLEDVDKTVGASDDNLDLRSTNSDGSGNRNSSATLPTPPEDDRISLPSETEDHVLFPNVVYLGAASMRSPRAEAEIMKYLATLSREEKTSVLVDLLVPRIPQGTVVLYEQGTEDEVAKYPVFRIIFCAKGGKTTDTISNCFAFTFGHGSNEEAVFLCHAFRCQSAEQVTNIMMCFASAFRKPVTSGLSQGESAFVFDVSVEIKEEDSKGAAYAACPREGRDCFKLRANLPKEIVVHVLQVGPENPHLSLEKCSGVWLAAGKNISRSDLQRLSGESWSNNGKQFNVFCRFDPREEKFLLLNTETPGEHRSYMTIVVDITVAGFEEPLTFIIRSKARIFPPSEKFWMPGRRQLQETFFLRLFWKGTKESNKGFYKVINLESQSQREGRFPSVLPALDASSSEDETADSDSEEQMLSGSGRVSRECEEGELKVWSEILTKWRTNLAVRPKYLNSIIRRDGIPQSLRCEVWQNLAGCFNSDELLEKYKSLSVQDSPWESEITKDISRTFPAHEFFKEAGSEGQDQLFRVIKAYSIYDPETGYSQSLSFIAATILLQMPEENAFCLFVRVMENYGVREMMRNDFEGLRVRFHQLNCLIEEKIPDLHFHLQDTGVEVHMFATQWFLTLFTARFPLFCVFRVFDLFLCDGQNVPVLFQVAIALLRLAKNDLLSLDFEGILRFFRLTLPKRYKNEDFVSVLLQQAVTEKISRKKMAQYEAAQVQERNAEDPLERAKKDTRELMGTVMRLERENDQLAHELINGKIQLRNELDNAEDMNELQQKEIARLNCLVIDAEDETKRLRDEASMVKELCRNMENETRRIEESKSQYKQINLQLEKRLEIMTAKLHSVQNGLCKACKFPPDGDTAQSNCQTNPDEEKIKMLELELARTKLALVEKECYTQELLHQLNLASQGDQASKNSWLSKTTKSLGTMVGVGSSFERRTSGSASSVARNSFSNSKDTGVEREPSNSSHDLS